MGLSRVHSRFGDDFEGSVAADFEWSKVEDVVVSIDSDLIFVDGLLYFSCPPEIVAEVYLPLLFHRTPDSHFGGGIRSVEIVELDRTF